MTYTLKDLEKDLKRLDKKTERLATWMDRREQEPNRFDYAMDFRETQTKVIASIYMAKMMEFYMKYFECKIPIKIKEE